MWTAWGPGFGPETNNDYLARGNRRFTWPRRWKTAAAAMREVDRLYPLKRKDL